MGKIFYHSDSEKDGVSRFKIKSHYNFKSSFFQHHTHYYPITFSVVFHHIKINKIKLYTQLSDGVLWLIYCKVQKGKSEYVLLPLFSKS